MKRTLINTAAVLALFIGATDLRAQWLTTGNVAGGTDKLGTLNFFPLTLITNGMDRMLIKADGDVCIGTASSIDGSGVTYKLSVEGRARAREVFVNMDSWPDFVFSPGYRLESLDSLHNYVTANRHLPAIPSEAAVVANGLPLGEMNKLLLMKIEELHLYLIQLHERVKELESEKAANSTTNTNE